MCVCVKSHLGILYNKDVVKDVFVFVSLSRGGQCLTRWQAQGSGSAPPCHLGRNSSDHKCELGANMLHRLTRLTVRDVRFPTSLEQHGSDAMVRTRARAPLERRGLALTSAFVVWSVFCLCCPNSPHCSTQTPIIQPHMWSWTRTAGWKASA